MKAGDHLRVLRAGAWDHAIDLGDRTVIRYVPGAGLQRAARGDFVAGAERGEVVVHREPTFRAQEVVARAFSRFAESAYGAMFRSAEQFAVWCKNGQLPAAPPPPPARRAARAAGPAARGRKAPAARKKATRSRGKGSGKRAAATPRARKPPARRAPAAKRKAAGRRSPKAGRRPARPGRSRRRR